jgi:hypothetical protein
MSPASKWVWATGKSGSARDEIAEIVVVDQREIDLAIGDALELGAVVAIDLGVVGDHAFEPFARDVVALRHAQGGDPGLERAVGGRPCDAAAIFLVGQIHDRGRQVASSTRSGE